MGPAAQRHTAVTQTNGLGSSSVTPPTRHGYNRNDYAIYWAHDLMRWRDMSSQTFFTAKCLHVCRWHANTYEHAYGHLRKLPNIHNRVKPV